MGGLLRLGADKAMFSFGRTSPEIHELVKLQHATAAAGVSFSTVMEDGRSRVEQTFLVSSVEPA